MRKNAFSFLGVLTLMVAQSAFSGATADAQSCKVRGWYNSTAVPIIGEISVPFTKLPGHEELSVGFDDHAVFSEFSRPDEDEMDVLIETTYPQTQPFYDADRDSTVLSMQPMPRVYLIGERKLVVVVGSGVAAKSLTLGEIGAILAGNAGEGKEGGIPPLRGGVARTGGIGQGKGHLYCEPDKSWCRGALSAWCMQYVIQKTGYKILAHHPFREDITDCVDGDDVVAKVKRDPRGIGFFQYRPGMKLDGVHVVPIGGGDAAKGKPPVAFKEGDWLQEDYPFSEPILLYLHPKAPPLAKEFCEFAVGKEAAGIAEKYGVVTAYAQKQAEGEQRLREAAEGTVPEPTVAVVGPEQVRGVMRDVEPEYVRSCAVMRMQYVVASGEGAVEAWHRRHGVMILSEADLKKLGLGGGGILPLRGGVARGEGGQVGEGRGGQAGTTGGAGTVGGTPVLLASRSVAVVVNMHNPLKSLTVEELREAFVTGKLPAGTVPMGMGAEIHEYGVDVPDPASYLFWRGIGASGTGGSGRVKYEKSADGVVQGVSADRAGIGFVNFVDLPADLKKAGIKVLAIGGGGAAGGAGDADRAALPGEGGDGKYPLSERWYLLVDPQADLATKEFADYLTGGSVGDATGSASDVFGKDGFISAQADPTDSAKQ